MEILGIYWKEIMGIIIGCLVIGYILLSICAIPKRIAKGKDYPLEI